MQFSGVFARIFLGWLADRTGTPSRNLTAQAFVAAALVAGYGMLPDAPAFALTALLAGATGFFAASWNGIYMAEIARLSPPDRIVEATSSGALIAFCGYTAGPSLFSLLVTLTGQYRIPFFVIAAQLALMGVAQIVVMLRRRAGAALLQ
jgi:MFS family permease